MKGTEIGTRAGCALCHLLSPRVHTMMDMPFPRMSRPAQRMPPFARSVRREKELWEQRTGAWELGAVKCLYIYIYIYTHVHIHMRFKPACPSPFNQLWHMYLTTSKGPKQNKHTNYIAELFCFAEPSV